MEGEKYWPSGQFEPERAAIGPYTISISATKNYAAAKHWAAQHCCTFAALLSILRISLSQ